MSAMTMIPSEASAARDDTLPVDVPEVAAPSASEPAKEPPAAASRTRSVQPVLEKLFELYPHLFGSSFLPLKLGIFQDLLAAHPDHFQRDSLKAALGFHTRSTRYLQCVAAGHKRHDLQGNASDDVAPEHVYLTLLELFRRRQARAREDLRPKFRAQLMAAFEASGLSRQDYQVRVQTNDVEATALLEEAFAEREQKVAKREALRRTFESSGKTAEEFADMYGIDKRELAAVIRA
jgi:ProP effector